MDFLFLACFFLFFSAFVNFALIEQQYRAIHSSPGFEANHEVQVLKIINLGRYYLIKLTFVNNESVYPLIGR